MKRSCAAQDKEKVHGKSLKAEPKRAWSRERGAWSLEQGAGYKGLSGSIGWFVL